LPSRLAEPAQHPLRGAAPAGKAGPKPAAKLNPLFEMDGESYVMMTQFAAAIPAAELGERRPSLRDHDIDIHNALDMLISGI
jgi:toxin CcdB